MYWYWYLMIHDGCWEDEYGNTKSSCDKGITNHPDFSVKGHKDTKTHNHRQTGNPFWQF